MEPGFLTEWLLWTDGKVYESTIDNNVWSPDAYPQGWKEVIYGT